ncbi:MAG: 2'-5' RNA ligase family protein [Dermatophilaceae bacterium]
MAHSVLVVPVAEMERFVRARHEHYDPAYVSADPAFAHAHVTALGPFAPLEGLTSSVVEQVGRVLGSVRAFAFRLERVATFPNGIIHLVPEPAVPFCQLTAALWRAFPAYPPYAGEFGDVAPHLTLDAVGDGVDERSVRSAVERLVPLDCVASEVRLSWYEPGACRTLARWPLGVSPFSRG